MKEWNYLLAIMFVAAFLADVEGAETGLDLCNVVSSIELDPCLEMIAKDPSIMKKIDQKNAISTNRYSSLIKAAMLDAESTCSVLVDKQEVRSSKVAVCAVDARVYFWNSYSVFDVIGWIDSWHLSFDDEEFKMTVWVVSRNSTDIEIGGLQGSEQVFWDLMNTDLDIDKVREFLKPRFKNVAIKMGKSGRLVQLELDLILLSKGDVKLPYTTFPIPLIPDWPPEGVDSSPWAFAPLPEQPSLELPFDQDDKDPESMKDDVE